MKVNDNSPALQKSLTTWWKREKELIRIYKLVNLFLIPTSIVFISNQQKNISLFTIRNQIKLFSNGERRTDSCRVSYGWSVNCRINWLRNQLILKIINSQKCNQSLTIDPDGIWYDFMHYRVEVLPNKFCLSSVLFSSLSRLWAAVLWEKNQFIP